MDRFLLTALLVLLSAPSWSLNNYYFTHSQTNNNTLCGSTTTKYASSQNACSAMGACSGANAPLSAWGTADSSQSCGALLSCRNKNGVSMGGSVYSKKVCCPSGQEYDGTACVDMCDEGEIHDPITGVCREDCESPEIWDDTEGMCRPECEAPEVWDTIANQCDQCPSGQTFHVVFEMCMVDCPSGQEADPFDPLDATGCQQPLCSDEPGTTPVAPLGWDGPNIFYHCQPIEPEEENTCDPAVDPAGYVDGVPVCQDEIDDCEDDGGTVGMYNGEQVCLPEQENVPNPPTIPNCKTDGSEVLQYNEPTENWTCENVMDEPTDIPTEEPDCKDTDDDGICNRNDPDIDNDGIPNSEDDDKDGDGVDNGDDETPTGGGGDGEDGQDEPGEVSGGGNCDDEPECKGDAIQCAIVYQTYKTRCELLQGDTEEDIAEMIEGDTVESLDGGETELSDAMAPVYAVNGAAGSCPSPTSLTISGQAVEIDYQPVCDLAAMIRPFLIMLASIAGFMIVLKAL